MDEIFGGLFDFDNNGVTDNFEMALGFELFSDATMNFFGEEETRRSRFEFEEMDSDDPFYDPLIDDDF